MTTTLYLIRHSEKMRMHGSHDLDRILPLSAVGEHKAEKLLDLEALRHADAAYASPFSRTIATLHYFLDADHVPLALDERLKELEFGLHGPEFSDAGNDGPHHMSRVCYIPRAEAHPMPPMPPKGGKDDIRAKQWDDRNLAAPGGESLNECAARMTAVMQDIVQANQGKKLLVASHGAAICAYLSQYLPEIDDAYTGALPQPAVFEMIFEDDRDPVVQRLL